MRVSPPPPVLRRLGLAAAAFLLVLDVSPATSGEPFPGRRGDGRDLLGTPAPELRLEEWVTSEPLEIGDLRGSIALIRWFTDTCPFCSTSAPSLVDLHREYASRGLRVIGVFHPKPPGDGDPARAARAAERFGFTFPVAIDPDWSALRRWWLEAVPRGWTSVSFILDREGIIRYVHPGGEYHLGEAGGHWNDHSSCRAEYREIEGLIRELLRK